VESVYTIKIHDKSLHKCNWQQGDIVIFEIEFYGWWFLGYIFFYWWWGSFTIFFGGWWGWKICASRPPHTFNSGTALIHYWLIVVD